jgi:endonuclease YncB( thermonuclease family)
VRKLVRYVLLLLAASTGFAAPTLLQATELAGYATVIDAGHIAIRGKRIALAYIKTPNQTDACPKALQLKCSQDAAFGLAALIEKHQVSCKTTPTDTPGIDVGICKIGPYDISLSMIARGWAQPISSAPEIYHQHYATAQASGAGIWSNSMTKNTAPCLIKGIIQGTKRYFLLPEHPSYAQTTVNPANGDQWFCTEKQAFFAGWKKLP